KDTGLGVRLVELFGDLHGNFPVAGAVGFRRHQSSLCRRFARHISPLVAGVNFAAVLLREFVSMEARIAVAAMRELRAVLVAVGAAAALESGVVVRAMHGV